VSGRLAADVMGMSGTHDVTPICLDALTIYR
jgi:hypothetical protein